MDNEIAYTKLMKAAFANDLKMVEDELRKGGDPNAVVGARTTAMHIAASKGNARIVQCLIDGGAEISILNSDRSLVATACCHSPEVLRLLIDHGADLMWSTYMAGRAQILCSAQ